MTALYSEANFYAEQYRFIELAQAFKIFPDIVHSYVRSVQELAQTFKANPTAEQSQIFFEKLSVFKSSYKAFLINVNGLVDVIADSAIVNDPANQELFQNYAKFESDIITLDASTAFEFFTSQETASNTARALVLGKQAYDKYVADKISEFSNHDFIFKPHF